MSNVRILFYFKEKCKNKIYKNVIQVTLSNWGALLIMVEQLGQMNLYSLLTSYCPWDSFKL